MLGDSQVTEISIQTGIQLTCLHERHQRAWCRYGGVASSREMISNTGVQPHSQGGCSRISTWSCSGSAVPRSTSKPQIASCRRGAACSFQTQPRACTVCFGNKSTSSLAADTQAFEQIHTPPTWPL